MVSKLVEKCEKALAVTALEVTKTSVNSFCTWVMYEPELPKGAERFKRNDRNRK